MDYETELTHCFFAALDAIDAGTSPEDAAAGVFGGRLTWGERQLVERAVSSARRSAAK